MVQWLLGFPSSRVEHSVPRIADEYLVGTACLDRVGLGSIHKRPTLGLACGNSKHREGSCVIRRKKLSSSSLEEQICMVSGGLGLVSSQALDYYHSGLSHTRWSLRWNWQAEASIVPLGKCLQARADGMRDGLELGKSRMLSPSCLGS